MIYFDYLSQSFFDDQIHDIIPESAKEIDEQQHVELLIALNSGAKIKQDLTNLPQPSAAHIWQPENQTWVLDKAVQQQQFQAAKAEKMKTLNDAAQQFINAHADQVPEFEKLSWTIQGEEAKAWAQNPNSPTPVLDAIATQRQLPRKLLIQAALKKTLQYELLVATTAGQRQALQKRIELTQTETELNAIVIAFTLPESTS